MNPPWKVFLYSLLLHLTIWRIARGAPVGTSPRRLTPSSDTTELLVIPTVSEQEAEAFLTGLVYNSEKRSLTELIRRFQQNNDLEVTGMLNDETKLLIGSPHCGVKKQTDEEVLKWNKNSLTYRIHDFPKGKPSAVIRATITRAFMEWSKVTPLDFIEVYDTDSDIGITFGNCTHQKPGDFCVFPDHKTLAHAVFPENGEIHFNTKYFFSDEDFKLEDFLHTALHEIGHALGLAHINSRASLMHPVESNQFSEPQPIDIERIQTLYGSRKGGRVVRKTGPKLCTLSRIEAGIVDADGKRYLFAGDYYYDLDEKMPTGRLISSKWLGLPGKIDAAVRFIDDKSYFFKGDKVWRFKGSLLELGYPRLISKAFPGLPSNLDAILVDGDGDLYAFKGGKFWLYDAAKKLAERVTKGSVELLELPDMLDAVLDTDTSMMAFKDTDVYVLQVDGTWEEGKNSFLECRNASE